MAYATPFFIFVIFILFTSVGQMSKSKNKPAVILTFDDNWVNQYWFALPILEKNNFNATFFVYCLGMNQGPGLMTSNQLRDLYARGFDIESHSMTHADLTKLNAKKLDYETAQSKTCLEDMVPGANITIYAPPFAQGDDNSTVLAKIRDSGFEFARTGYSKSAHLRCAADWYVTENQSAGCQLYEPGTQKLKLRNLYNLPATDVNSFGRESNQDPVKTQALFEKLVNDGLTYDDAGNLVELSILTYHDLVPTASETKGTGLLQQSFKDQMQYLKDNDFRVLSMRDLQYHPENATFTMPTAGPGP